MKKHRLLLILFVLILLTSLIELAYSETAFQGTADVIDVKNKLLKGDTPGINNIFIEYQKKCEDNILLETGMQDLYTAFSETELKIEPHLTRWINENKKNWVSLVARATYLEALGGKARGKRWASETTEDQFNRMKSYDELAMHDVVAALKLNPRCIQAYCIALRINSNIGDMESNDILIKKALKYHPSSYVLRRLHMANLTPRWGGSYEQMEAFAKESLKYGNKNPLIKTLPGFVYWDQASMATIKRNYPLAIGLSKRALKYGENWNFRFTLAEAYYMNREMEKALIEIDRAITLRPNIRQAYPLKDAIMSSLGKR